MEKQTPRSYRLPVLMGNLTEAWRILATELRELVRKLRNDLDNGSMTFPRRDVAGIANVDSDDFHCENNEAQIRFYTDTSDGDRTYLVVRLEGTLKKVELT